MTRSPAKQPAQEISKGIGSQSRVGLLRDARLEQAVEGGGERFDGHGRAMNRQQSKRPTAPPATEPKRAAPRSSSHPVARRRPTVPSALSGAAGGRDALRARFGVRPPDRAPTVPLRSPPSRHEPPDLQMRGGRAREARGFAAAASPSAELRKWWGGMAPNEQRQAAAAADGH